MAITLEFLTQQLEIGDQLLAQRATMFEPQDLPGRYGRVVRALDHLLEVTGSESVLGGGWAVWHHGFLGRLTQDIDIALPAAKIDEFLQAASVAGFERLPLQPGRWPKLRHKETDVKVDILPEGAQPGSQSKPAPTRLPHPATMGAVVGILRYMNLNSLVELKIAAGRARDESDVVELVRANPDKTDSIRQHLANVHADYVLAYNRLVSRAEEQSDK